MFRDLFCIFSLSLLGLGLGCGDDLDHGLTRTIHSVTQSALNTANLYSENLQLRSLFGLLQQ